MTSILSIGKYEPPHITSNADVLEDVRKLSRNTFEGNIETLCAMLARLFVKSGTLLRRMPPPNGDYSLMQWMQSAAAEAFEKARRSPDSVDCVIFCGCMKGVTEPAQAALCAQAIGCLYARAFDISEACNGWVRALELADFYIKSGVYERVLILTAIESAPYGTPGEKGYAFNSVNEIAYKFGVLTIGSCATATLLEKSDTDQLNLKVQRIADNSQSTCCTISTAYHSRFTVPNSPFNRTMDSGQFVSHSAILYNIGRELTARAAKEFRFDDIGRILVTHTTSIQLYEEAVETWNLDVELFNLHPETGNLTESSMPLSIYRLLSQHRIRLGERISFAGHAAGLSLALTTFNVPAL